MNNTMAIACPVKKKRRHGPLLEDDPEALDTGIYEVSTSTWTGSTRKVFVPQSVELQRNVDARPASALAPLFFQPANDFCNNMVEIPTSLM